MVNDVNYTACHAGANLTKTQGIDYAEIGSLTE